MIDGRIPTYFEALRATVLRVALPCLKLVLLAAKAIGLAHRRVRFAGIGVFEDMGARNESFISALQSRNNANYLQIADEFKSKGF